MPKIVITASVRDFASWYQSDAKNLKERKAEVYQRHDHPNDIVIIANVPSFESAVAELYSDAVKTRMAEHGFDFNSMKILAVTEL